MTLSTSLGLRSLQQLRRAWVEVEQGALSRITGKVRAGLPADDLHLIRRQIDECLSEVGGAASARGRATRLGGVYLGLNTQGRAHFLQLLANEYGVDTDALRNATRHWLALTAVDDAEADRKVLLAAEEQLRQILKSPRVRLLSQFNDLPEGIKFLVDMRAELIEAKGEDIALQAFDREFRDLLASWFDVGFLELRRITWNAPATLLETLAEHEAVHAIRSWQDIKHRLAASDRRCYAFIHPQMPNDPLIFVWVALTAGIAERINDLLRVDHRELDPAKVDTAVFYSISATQPGLDGVGFGSFLIKQVVDRLNRDYKQLKNFTTLSPMPGFRSWINERLDKSKAGEQEHSRVTEALQALREAGALQRMFSDRSWLRDHAALERARQPLLILAAHYLVQEKRGQGARDQVANFHLSNGASVDRLNFPGDIARRGQERAAGLMVNYRYRLKDIEANHESYHDSGEIAQSRTISSLLKTRISV
ncbi:MAG: malonyl-CoA decarboxylase family protein [Arenicellales bacterium]|jgi:malonyl-CoA decarboxylase|nr:malonyl-CoA decarboxylase family protein [Arenicellales bacterium]|tara:strand:+ start:1032 stop:2471 length:1440 start_codon:yes stop_codon:yes gene_type:complete